MSIRRHTDPTTIQRIWDAIKLTINQKSLPNDERLTRHFARVYGMSETAAQIELNKAVDDGLVFLKKTQTKSGSDSDTYRLPSEPPSVDTHDWYCFKCQKGGNVECCQSCFRVFHLDCHVPKDTSRRICELCEAIDQDEYKISPAALNHILAFTCGHLKAKLPPEITNRTITTDAASFKGSPGAQRGPTWISEGEDAWRPTVLIKNHMDLAIMEAKTKKNEYKCLAEFQADAQNILHNILVYHGEASAVGEMGIIMYQDCCYDIKEIRRCADCYRISNEKSQKMWFCIPCDPPHQLVYAKQKGYPYWPAKVMAVKDNWYDVRFFGGHHMRANIEKVFIRPITTKLQSLQPSDKGKWKEMKIKRSPAWNRAFEELKYHQGLLQNLGPYTMTHDTEDKDGPKPAKIRNIVQPTGSKVSFNGVGPSKQILKDLRVKVERLTPDGYSEGPLSQAKDSSQGAVQNCGSSSSSSSSSASEDVPRLPVAEDEPTRPVSMACPEGLKKEGSQEDMVTSSCQEPRSKCVLVQTEQIQENVPAKVKRERRTSDQPITTALEKLRRELELDKCRELERLQAEHAKELRQITDKHQQVVSEIKKKQWCYNCEAEAIYHCCWNTAYCSTDCQQVHWQREHKRVCRRKR